MLRCCHTPSTSTGCALRACRQTHGRDPLSEEVWQMGHRTMDTPNLGGRTVPRHHVPKRARRSRKRTLRATTKTQRPVKPDEPTPRKPAIRVAARTQKPAKPTPRKWAIRVAAKTQKFIKPAEQTPPKQAPQIAAKTQEPVKPAAPAQRSEEEIVGDKGKRVPLDYLQDGAIEWGIKREGEEGSGT